MSKQTTHPTEETNQQAVREAVGIFDDTKKLERAVHALQLKFPHHALSVLGDEKHIKDKLIDPNQSDDIVDNEKIIRGSPIKAEERNVAAGSAIGISAYVGAVAAALAAGAVSMPLTISVAAIAGLSSGGAAAVLVKLLGDKMGRKAEEQINSGGLFLWVNTPTTEEENLACNILREHGAIYVEAHSIH